LKNNISVSKVNVRHVSKNLHTSLIDSCLVIYRRQLVSFGTAPSGTHITESISAGVWA